MVLENIDKRYRWLLYSILILLVIYTDSPLQSFLESFGESLLPLISILLFILLFPFNYFKKEDTFINKFFLLVCYTALISILSWAYYVASGTLELKGDFIPIKTFKVMLYYVGYLCYLKLLVNLAKGMDLEEIFKPFLITFFILTLILLVELQQIPDAFPQFHYHAPPYNRVRLLSSESSWTAGQIQVFASISLYYAKYIKKSSKLVVLVLLCLIIHLLASGSKTLLVSVFAFILMSMLMNMKKNSLVTKLGIILVGGISLVVAYLVMLPGLLESFGSDIEEATSTVTRVYTMICGISIGVVFPFGTGYVAYLDLLPYTMDHYTWVVGQIFDSYNLDEVIELTSDNTGANLSVKSFLGQSTIYWGILGSFYFVKILIDCLKKTEKSINGDGFWIIKSMFYLMIIELALTSALMYEFLAFVGVLIIMRESFSKRIVSNIG